MTALGTRPSVKDADLVRVCVCVGHVLYLNPPLKWGAGEGDTNTHTAGCKQIGEIMAIATKLYVLIAGLSARVRTFVRRMQMRQIACSKIERRWSWWRPGGS